jgi:hypothetical protein
MDSDETYEHDSLQSKYHSRKFDERRMIEDATDLVTELNSIHAKIAQDR